MARVSKHGAALSFETPATRAPQDEGGLSAKAWRECMHRISKIVLGVLLLGSTNAYAQDPVADFYRGRTVTLQVGSEPGGGYDVVARTVARFMGKHIPGAPNLIVQNVPGGGSLRLANQMYNVAPRDGSLFGLASNGMPTTPLLSPE